MPLPINDLFERFISETKLITVEPKENSVPFDISAHSNSNVLYLSYPEMELKLDSVINRIKSELHSIGHESNYEIALATLGIIAETRDPESSAIEHANIYLSKTYNAKLRQIIVLADRTNPGYKLQIGEFWLREFNPTDILNWAQRCKCGFPQCITSLKDCFSIEHAIFTTELINWWGQLSSIKRMYNKWGKDVWDISVMDIYYQAITESYKEKWPDLMKEEIKILEAGALIHFDINNILNSINVQNISLFQWASSTGKGGWALMTSRNILHMNFIPPTVFADCIEWMYCELGFKSLSEKKLDKAITSYSHFLQRAHDHRLYNNIDEAFLHFIIALDMLFGLEGQSTTSVFSRASLLVHRQLNQSFKKQNEILKRLYNTRSKYVHEGKKVDERELEEAEIICSQVLWVLLTISGQNKANDIGELIQEVDFLIATIHAERKISDDQFSKIGVPCKGHRPVPPNRIENLF